MRLYAQRKLSLQLRQSGQGSLEYQPVSDDYFASRGLRRYAGIWSLWALGVGAVISGNFFGWNFGLSAGGFSGLAIATVIVATMYVGISYTIAELSAAMPYAGGPYAFVRAALGPLAGFITGLAAMIEFVLTPAVIVVGIGGYIGTIFNSAFGVDVAAPIWWLIFYAVFVGINIIGVEATFKVTVATTFLALAALCVFWVVAIPNFSWELALNIDPEGGNSTFLPFGWSGVALAIPFAIWFYLAIEQVPFAAEESVDPKNDIPKAMVWGIGALIVASALTLVLGSGIAPGAASIGESDEPLLLAFETVLGDGIGAALLSVLALTGLVASFHAIIYAYGRNVFSLARAGYLPKWMSNTHRERKTPHVALIVGAIMGYVVALLIEFGDDWLGSGQIGGGHVGAMLLNMAVFGAVITYIAQMLAFVVLRRRHPGMVRPYISSLGVAGASVAGLIGVAALVLLFLNPDFRLGLYGCLACLLVGVAYFAAISRKHLVRSPEEEFAIDLARAHDGG